MPELLNKCFRFWPEADQLSSLTISIEVELYNTLNVPRKSQVFGQDHVDFVVSDGVIHVFLPGSVLYIILTIVHVRRGHTWPLFLCSPITGLPHHNTLVIDAADLVPWYLVTSGPGPISSGSSAKGRTFPWLLFHGRSRRVLLFLHNLPVELINYVYEC